MLQLNAGSIIKSTELFVSLGNNNRVVIKNRPPAWCRMINQGMGNKYITSHGLNLLNFYLLFWSMHAMNMYEDTYCNNAWFYVDAHPVPAIMVNP